MIGLDMGGNGERVMGKFRVGDRVRFICGGYNDLQKVGCEATVIALDDDGDPIVDTDKEGETVGWGYDSVELLARSNALTLLDQFAMAALTGLLSDSNVTLNDGETLESFASDTAAAAYEYAQAMMRAREVQK